MVDLIGWLSRDFGNIAFSWRSVICVKNRPKDHEHVAEIQVRTGVATRLSVLADDPDDDEVVDCTDDATLRSELRRLVFARRIRPFKRGVVL